MKRPNSSLKTLLWLMGSVLILAIMAAAVAWVRGFERTMGRGYEELRREHDERERLRRQGDPLPASQAPQ